MASTHYVDEKGYRVAAPPAAPEACRLKTPGGHVRSTLAAMLPRARRWLPLLLVVLTALGQRHFVMSNTDVSWWISVAERMLDGQRLYVDVTETKPPAAGLIKF